MIQLPSRQQPVITEPPTMLIFGQPKVGKSSLVSALPKSLIIDLEEGAGYYENAHINVKKLCRENSTPEKAYGPVQALKEISDSIKKESINGISPYDFVIIDTTSVLEDIATSYATTLYKNTVMGKGFTGKDVVMELPNGNGYGFLRKAFLEILKWFNGTANKSIILIGHVKTASIHKDGKDISAKDINLSGKLKIAVCADSSATGFLYRDKDSKKNILSFKTSETDLATGSRLPYLANKEFVISEMTEQGLVTNWEVIFPSLKQV